MLKNQIARSNNGIERSKYITFGLPADGIGEARPRLAVSYTHLDVYKRQVHHLYADGRALQRAVGKLQPEHPAA